MKRLLFLIAFFCVCCCQVFSQTSIFSKYAVYFTDKNLNPFTLNDPIAFLSQKAIDRRLNYNISIDQKDLPVTPIYIFGIAQTGVKILNASKRLNCVTIETGDSLALISIRNMTFVDHVVPVGLITAPEGNGIYLGPSQTFTHHDDPLDYGYAWNQIHMVHGEYLHKKGYEGQGMTIAVIDAGFLNADSLLVFDSLRTNNQILGTYDFVEKDDTVYEDDQHGSMVLSTICGNLPGYMVGMAPKANVWLLRSEDAPHENIIEEYNWVSAAEFADSVGADVITSSLGYTQFDSTYNNHTYADMNGNTAPSSIGADVAASRGMLVFVSAGNEGDDPWHHISAPSDADSVIAVGAVDSFGVVTNFSGRGPSSDGRVKPNVCDQGGLSTIFEPNFGFIGRGSGTSFSGPEMAAISTCLWQAHRDKNFWEIKHAIEFSASFYSDPNDDYGYGIPDFQVADLYLSGELPDGYNTLSLPAVYPNPFHNDLQLLLFSTTTETLTFEMYNMLGQWVQNFNASVVNGYNKVHLNGLELLPDGIYLLRVPAMENNQVFKLLKN